MTETPRYRNAPPMGLRPAPQVPPRSMVRDTPAEMGVMGCAPLFGALLVFGGWVALVFVAMWALAALA